MSWRRLAIYLCFSLTAVLLFAGLGSLSPAADGKAQPKPAAKEAPHTLTLSGDDLLLGKVLAEVEKATGIPLEDRRQEKTDLHLKLDLQKATFWPAADAIARAADCRLSLFENDGKVALRDGPFREVAGGVCYDGLFRIAAKEIVGTRNLETDAHFYRLTLEVAWEPGFRPFFIESKPMGLEIRDEKNRELGVPQESGGRVPVEGRTATFEIKFEPPPRSVNSIALLKGKMAVLAPRKWLTFTFDPIAKLKADPKAREQTQDGVTAKIGNMAFDEDIWTIDVGLQYPTDGPKFESFESWLVYNEMSLKKDDSDKTYPCNAGFETGNATANRATVSYHFADEPKRKFVRGKPDDWRVIYLTPGPIVEIPVSFEFKDLVLP
jgi:hypothetical protein